MHRRLSAFAGILLALSLQVSEAGAQKKPGGGGDKTSARVEGSIIDASTGAVVRDADVMFIKDRRFVVSDSTGHYSIDSLPSGIVQLVVRAKSFPPLMLTVALMNGESMNRVIELDSTSSGRKAAQQLPRVAIEALRDPIPRFADFERRRSTGRGQYLVREEIERANFASLQDAMRGLRGVNIECGGGLSCVIRMARAPMRCPPEYIVDERVDNWFGPSTPIRDIEAIEVYTGPSDVPGEFAGRSAGCGVIVIWTRSGPSRRKGKD